MTMKTTMKAALAAALTALVVVGAFAGAGSAADDIDIAFAPGTVVYTLNGVDWIPYNDTTGAAVVLNASSALSGIDIASYLFNMTFTNGSKKLIPSMKTIEGWDTIHINASTSTGIMYFDSAVIEDGKSVSENELLFNMSIVPNIANVTLDNTGVMTPYVVYIDGTDSYVGQDGGSSIASFAQQNVTGTYTFNILPDPYYNYTVYGVGYDNNGTTNTAVAYVYTEDGFNNNGKVIVASNISKTYESASTGYTKVFNLTWSKDGTTTITEKTWNISGNVVSSVGSAGSSITLKTALTGEDGDFSGKHSGALKLSSIKWSDVNGSNFKGSMSSVAGQSANPWNLANASVSVSNATFGPKAYNASANEYNGNLLGQWDTNVLLPRLVSADNYSNCSDIWWDKSNASKITAYYKGESIHPVNNSDGTYTFTFTGGEFVTLNMTNGKNFNITNVSSNVVGNERFTIKIEGYLLGDVNFDDKINVVDSAVIGVIVGKKPTFDSAAGTANLNGLTPVTGQTNATTYISADITKSGETQGATDVKDLQIINKYLLGLVDADGN